MSRGNLTDQNYSKLPILREFVNFSKKRKKRLALPSIFERQVATNEYQDTGRYIIDMIIHSQIFCKLVLIIFIQTPRINANCRKHLCVGLFRINTKLTLV